MKKVIILTLAILISSLAFYTIAVAYLLPTSIFPQPILIVRYPLRELCIELNAPGWCTDLPIWNCYGGEFHCHPLLDPYEIKCFTENIEENDIYPMDKTMESPFGIPKCMKSHIH